MWKIFRKSFQIELKESLTYPSANDICSAITKDQKNVEFISKEKPVTFKIEDGIYEVEVGMARGGYILSCKEINKD